MREVVTRKESANTMNRRRGWRLRMRLLIEITLAAILMWAVTIGRVEATVGDLDHGISTGGKQTAYLLRNNKQALTAAQQTGVLAAMSSAIPQKKNITPLRVNDTPEGSRVTITSDVPLNDYSSYRSGDRFFVIIPGADATHLINAILRGRGFEDVQIQERGNDAVFSFRLQPGTSAHVNEKFNRLEILFTVPSKSATNIETSAGTTPINITSPLISPSDTNNPNTTVTTTRPVTPTTFSNEKPTLAAGTKLGSVAARDKNAKSLPAACVENLTAPPPSQWRWPENRRVTVAYLKGVFTPEEKAALGQAVRDWNELLSEIGSGNSISVKQEDISEASNLDGYVYVTRGPTYDSKQRHLAFIAPNFRPDSRDRIQSAIVSIDHRVHDILVLQAVFSHEIAHSFGLWDCPKCKRGSTIMALFKGMNKGNGLLTPGTCDLSIVKSFYH